MVMPFNIVWGMVIQRKRYTFRKTDRLLRRYEFNGLKTSGRKIHTYHFLAVYAPGERASTRIGITVSRRVGNAVVRNRIKRGVREYFRKNKCRIIGTWDIHVIAKNQAAEAENKEIEKAMDKLFGQLPFYKTAMNEC